MGDFSDAVFRQVRLIPRGKVSTYGQIARLIGSPRSARYVGYALRGNPSPGMGEGSIPCHRVVFKDGSLCKSFAFGGPDEQRKMLEAEGVSFADGGRVDLAACLWDPHCDVGVSEDDEGGVGNKSGEGGKGGVEYEGNGGVEGARCERRRLPMAPPADFDWKRELGEIGG